jgi:hypothetical protein
MIVATFWVDGEMPFIIGKRKLRHQAEFIAEQFVSRMTHPEVGIWWIEYSEGDDDGEDTDKSADARDLP